jgi:hypothetical protein
MLEEVGTLLVSLLLFLLGFEKLAVGFVFVVALKMFVFVSSIRFWRLSLTEMHI